MVLWMRGIRDATGAGTNNCRTLRERVYFNDDDQRLHVGGGQATSPIHQYYREAYDDYTMFECMDRNLKAECVTDEAQKDYPSTNENDIARVQDMVSVWGLHCTCSGSQHDPCSGSSEK
ncbi:hypothetical protein TNCV_2898891 [Trichonephila clavipes]|nr:hypothetical protein TNCV_2898891 [Trichonephila clavipes]